MQETPKLLKLKKQLELLESVAVAFSGGVDSTLLLYLAHQQLKNRCVAITTCSPLFPKRELEDAKDFCKEHKIEHLIIERDELSIPGFENNPPERCYICKKELMQKMSILATQKGLKHVVEGSHLDDDGDFRPGKRALKELRIISPLCDAGLTKEEIRAFSLKFDLKTHDKPSLACLATRFPYNEPLTKSALLQVAQAEQWLIDEGILSVRVRVHGDVARIEVDRHSMDRFLDENFRRRVHEELLGLGFKFVALDLLGYKMGSMNSTIN